MSQNSNESLGRKIARLRIGAGMTQERLANQLNVSAQAVSKWENDQSYPDIMLLPVLADVFGVSVDELLGRTVAVRSIEAAPGPEPQREPQPESLPALASPHTPEPDPTRSWPEEDVTVAPTRIRIRIDSVVNDDDKLDISFPLAGVKAMANFVGMLPSVRNDALEGIDLGELFAAAQSLEAGTVMDLDDGKDRILITLE